MVDYYNNGKLAHVYIINTNATNLCLNELLNVIKKIFCSELEEDKKSSLCHLIDINNLPSLKVIYPDGKFIKKEQILELKSLFSKNSQYTKTSIYVIIDAEKMNKESANSMLKFLEEPDGDVVGFLVTSSYDSILPTIQSRCQKVDCFYDYDHSNNNGVDNKDNNYLMVAKEFLYEVEVNKKLLTLVNKELFSTYEKNDIINIAKIILEVYHDFLIGREVRTDFDFLKKLSKSNLKKKMNILVEFLKEINFNVNIDLLLDRLVIELDGVNNEGL